MILGLFTKQPVDVFSYTVDYNEWLTDGDNVQSTIANVDQTGMVIDAVFVNDPLIKLIISGGNHGTTYKITVTTTTADGLVKQDEFKIKVKEI